MKNYNQCECGLVYNEFSIILIQTFTSPGIEIPDPEELEFKSFIKKDNEGNFDNQLFTNTCPHHPWNEGTPHDQTRTGPKIERYRLKGFDICIDIGGLTPARLWGHVHVRATVFFNKTVEISYRIIVTKTGRINGSKFCQTDVPFNTDQLIAVAGIVQHVEHWVYNKKLKGQEIDGSLKIVTISDLHLDERSNFHPTTVRTKGITFEEVQRRYRYFFDRQPCKDHDKPKEEKEFEYGDHNYIFLDIWESIGHSGRIRFDRMREDQVIEHIEQCHKAELVGLMTLYPEEWPYRMDSSYEDVCGKNIAIDTDDLVLANETMSLVVGTYGNRGKEAPTDWKKHLARRDRYHVSWPEYLVLVEILLAKKHTINYVLNKYIFNSRQAIRENSRTDSKDGQQGFTIINDKILDMIEQNARLSISLSDIILQLDSVRYLRYMSHKHMYHETSRRLRIEDDERQLKEITERVDKSLTNANNIADLKEANSTKNILLFISIASLFGVLLEGNGEAPVFSMISKEFGVFTAVLLVIITSIGIYFSMKVLIRVIIHYLRKKRISKKSRN